LEVTSEWKSARVADMRGSLMNHVIPYEKKTGQLGIKLVYIVLNLQSKLLYSGFTLHGSLSFACEMDGRFTRGNDGVWG
jgi:hypothetical protein